MNRRLVNIAAAALLLGAACGPVTAQVQMLQMSSDAILTSALIPPQPWASTAAVQNTFEWDAAGHHLRTATPDGQPPGSAFASDRLLAWADFEQRDEGSAYHSFAQVGGYYLDAGPWNQARNEVWLSNRMLIGYDALAGPRISFRVVHTSHGELLTGGIANNLRVAASEQLSWGLRIATQGALVFPYQAAGQWSGSAELPAEVGAAPVVTGDWRTRWRSSTRAIDGLYEPAQGIELSALLVGDAIDILPGQQFLLDLQFHGLYAVHGTADTGYLSLGMADFSHSGAIGFEAIDMSTGLPTDALQMSLLGPVPAPVPEPGPGWLLLAGLAAGHGARSQGRMGKGHRAGPA